MGDSNIPNLEIARQKLITVAEELCFVASNSGDASGNLSKELDEVRWYLGEERERRQQLERSLQERDTRIQQLEEELGKFKKQLDESQWFLGEERAKLQEIQKQLPVK